MLTTWHEAVHELEGVALRRASLRMAPDAALVGLRLAADAAAREGNPRFRMSAMDGWAIHRADLGKRAARADHGSGVLAGMKAGALAEGTSCPVMTGAPVPDAAAAVIPVEDVVEENGTVVWKAAVEEGMNIRRAGEDFMPGEVVLRAGTAIALHHLVLLRAAGVESVEVCARPRAALIQTGNELADAGGPLGEGAVFESTGECLLGALRAAGMEATAHRRVRDDREALREALGEALAGADLILTTGGVSKGVADHVPDVARELGGEVLLHRLAIKPSKPLLVARFPSGAILVGLPGNPVSQLLAFQAVAMPLAEGRAPLGGMRRVAARLLGPCAGKETFRTFVRGVASVSPEGQLCVAPLEGNESHRVANLAACNAWIHATGRHAAGATVEVSPFLNARWDFGA